MSILYWYLFILSLSGFVTSFGAHVVATNLPSYAEMVGVGTLMIGLLIAIYDFAELFAKPLSGFIADRKGMKLTLFIGLIVFILGSLIFFLVNPKWLLLVRFIQGLGAAALSTVSITLVAKYFTIRRGRAFGIYNAIKGAGYVISPALGGFIIHRFGFPMIFLVSAAVGGTALLFSFFLPKDRGVNKEILEEEKISFRQLFLVFKEKRLLPIYAIIVINMFLVSILFGFLPVYLYSIHYTPFQSGLVISTVTASYILVQPFAGHLADKLSFYRIIFIGMLLAIFGIGVITFTSGFPLIVLSCLAGIGVGAVWTNSDALVSSVADPNKLGISMGATQSFKELGDMVGPLMIGALTEFFGVHVGFVMCSFLALLFLPLLNQKKKI